MARNTAYFQVRECFQGPQARAFSMDALTAQEWDLYQEIRNVVRVDIDTASTEPRTEAVMPAWRYGTDDTRLADWHVEPAPDEEAYALAAQDLLQTELDQVQASIAADVKAAKTPATADLQREGQLQADLAQLGAYRLWTEVENSFGDGATGLYRACNAANIPFKLRSNWSLGADRPFTLWFYRCQPHEAQAASWLRFRFGAYALEFKQESEVTLTRYKDGRFYTDDPENPGQGRGTWKSYDGTDYAAIDAIEAQITEIRDIGRLTADDRNSIAGWKQQIATLKAAAKTNGAIWKLAEQTGLGANGKPANEAAITELQKQIDDLKQGKTSLNAGEDLAIKQLEDSYLADSVSVQFAHMAEATIGQPFAITVIPQPRGYLVLHCSQGKDYFCYRNQEVTDSGVEAQIVRSTPIEIDGNGGAFWAKASYIQPEGSGYLLSLPRTMPGPVAQAGQITLDATAPAGTMIAGSFLPSGDSAFQFRIDFTAAGGYLPFLYRARVEFAASPRDRSLETVLLDSRSSAACAGVAVDYGFAYERANRGRTATLILRNVPRDSTHGPLELLAEKQVQFFEDGRPWFTGVLREPEIEYVGPGLEHIKYPCYDRWYLMRKDGMYSEGIGDGKQLGVYLGEVAQGIGLWPNEVSIKGGSTTRVLPKAPPGEAPALVAEYAGLRAEWAQRLYDDFALNADMWFSGAGAFRVDDEGAQTKEIAFHLASTGYTDTRVMMEAKLETSFEDFANDHTVQGRLWHGYPLTARYQDWGSVNSPTIGGERNLAYAGRWIPAPVYHSENLVTQGDVDLALRWRVKRFGFPYFDWVFRTYWDAFLEINDVVTCAGVSCKIVEVRADSRATGWMQVRARVIT